MGVTNPWEPVQTYSNTQTPRTPLPVHEKDGAFGVLTTQVSKLIDWSRSSSLWKLVDRNAALPPGDLPAEPDPPPALVASGESPREGPVSGPLSRSERSERP